MILTSLVYEKQERLRIIMKMHGLGDGPYWLISYAYFLTISVLYVASLVIFGSVIGLNYFRLNSYSVQFVFYFIYLNLQIAIAFLVSTMFSKVKTVTGNKYKHITFLESSPQRVKISTSSWLLNVSCCLHYGVWDWALGKLSLRTAT